MLNKNEKNCVLSFQELRSEICIRRFEELVMVYDYYD